VTKCWDSRDVIDVTDCLRARRSHRLVLGCAGMPNRLALSRCSEGGSREGGGNVKK